MEKKKKLAEQETQRQSDAKREKSDCFPVPLSLPLPLTEFQPAAAAQPTPLTHLVCPRTPSSAVARASSVAKRLAEVSADVKVLEVSRPQLLSQFKHMEADIQKLSDTSRVEVDGAERELRKILAKK